MYTGETAHLTPYIVYCRCHPHTITSPSPPQEKSQALSTPLVLAMSKCFHVIVFIPCSILVCRWPFDLSGLWKQAKDKYMPTGVELYMFEGVFVCRATIAVQSAVQLFQQNGSLYTFLLLCLKKGKGKVHPLMFFRWFGSKVLDTCFLRASCM